MKIRLLLYLGIISFLPATGQYFHESFDLQYNLRSSLPDTVRFKMSLSSYSFLKFLDTKPNIFDNFRMNTRFKVVKSQNSLLKKAEFGIGLQGFLTSNYKTPFVSSCPPIRISVYDSDQKNYVFTPAVQYIQLIRLNEKGNSNLQLALGLTYNIIGNDNLFSQTFGFGYDFSALLHIKVLSLQLAHFSNAIYTSYSISSSDVKDFIETDRAQISVPDDFQNLSFVTVSFGDYYLKSPAAFNEVLYTIYLSARNMVYSDKAYRSKISLKRLDYMAGFRIHYKGFSINPEFLLNNCHDLVDYPYSCLGYSIMAGYDFKKISIKAGDIYQIFYPLAVDLQSLKSAENIICNKLIVAVEYQF